MTPEERAFSIMAHVINLNGRDMGTIAQAIREAIAEEREACAKLAEAQAKSIECELPDISGGSWAKRFGRNVALSIVGGVPARGGTRGGGEGGGFFVAAGGAGPS